MYNIIDIMNAMQLSPATVFFFDEIFAKISTDSTLYSLMADAKENFLKKQDPGSWLDQVSDQLHIHRYCANLLLVLDASRDLQKVYKERGYARNLFYGFLSDVKSKMNECIAVYNIHGTFVLPWYERFFDCTRFCLGRLQFEANVLEKDYPGFGKAGDPVLNCHIPSGLPLLRSDVLASLSQAYEFFQYKTPMLVRCASWLLYPPHYSLYPDGSNLQSFYELFEIVEEVSYEHNREAWRIFNTVHEDMSTWPQNSRLQKNFYRYIKEGHTMGYGVGFMRYTPCEEDM